MSVSRDDFSIAFRSALLTKRRSTKIFNFIVIILAIFIFFLDVYGFRLLKQSRSIINDVVFRVSYIASSPSRFTKCKQRISSHFYLKEENEN